MSKTKGGRPRYKGILRKPIDANDSYVFAHQLAARKIALLEHFGIAWRGRREAAKQELLERLLEAHVPGFRRARSTKHQRPTGRPRKWGFWSRIELDNEIDEYRLGGISLTKACKAIAKRYKSKAASAPYPVVSWQALRTQYYKNRQVLQLFAEDQATFRAECVEYIREHPNDEQETETDWYEGQVK